MFLTLQFAHELIHHSLIHDGKHAGQVATEWPLSGSPQRAHALNSEAFPSDQTTLASPGPAADFKCSNDCRHDHPVLDTYWKLPLLVHFAAVVLPGQQLLIDGGYTFAPSSARRFGLATGYGKAARKGPFDFVDEEQLLRQGVEDTYLIGGVVAWVRRCRFAAAVHV
jgi:hypothetical protein